MTFIWAARGRDWGFRFLRNGGFSDPLPPYEAVFTGLDLGAQGYRMVGPHGALRLTDPEHRCDRAGRPLTHEFVLMGPEAIVVRSVDDGLREVWPQVRDEYARIWNISEPR